MSFEYQPIPSGADVFVQRDEPAETPAPAPDGDGAFWYPVFEGGSEIWQFPTGGSVRGAGVDGDVAVFASTDDNGYAVDVSTGDEL